MLRRSSKPLSPRPSQGLPYLQTNRVGRLSYVRRIPADLQCFAGNLKIFLRSLGLISTDQADPAVIQAWSRGHQSAEALIQQAKEAQPQEEFDKRILMALSPRHTAGIAAEPWRQILSALENGRSMPQLEASVRAIKPQVDALVWQLLQGASEHRQIWNESRQIEQVRFQLSRELLAPVLDSLSLAVDAPTTAMRSMQRGKRRILMTPTLLVGSSPPAPTPASTEPVSC